MNMENHDDLFEFEALGAAKNYRKTILQRFSPFLRGTVIEIGSGVGQFSRLLGRADNVSALHCVEPDERYHESLRCAAEGCVIHAGTIHDVPRDIAPAAIVSINVLEHIENDEEELVEYARRLAPERGHFCVFTPAGPGLYAPIDRRFGHFRRYSRKGLVKKLEQAGFDVVDARYFNFVGYFLWWLEFCIIQKAQFNVRKVAVFDRYCFPVIAAIERLCPPPLGQSVMVVARARVQRVEDAKRTSQNV